MAGDICDWNYKFNCRWGKLFLLSWICCHLEYGAPWESVLPVDLCYLATTIHQRRFNFEPQYRVVEVFLFFLSFIFWSAIWTMYYGSQCLHPWSLCSRKVSWPLYKFALYFATVSFIFITSIYCIMTIDDIPVFIQLIEKYRLLKSCVRKTVNGSVYRLNNGLLS